MEGEREQTRNQTEGSGQQQPLGQQDENQPAGQAGQQPQGQQSQQPSGQQQGQQPIGQQGQSASGQAQGSDTTTLNQDEGDVAPGGYSPESGASIFRRAMFVSVASSSAPRVSAV